MNNLLDLISIIYNFQQLDNCNLSPIILETNNMRPIIYSTALITIFSDQINAAFDEHKRL